MSAPARLVLVGGGHAHLFTLQRTAEFVQRGFEVIVIAPENFWYSGLATGVLGGQYAPEQDQVDVETLVKRGGGKFIRERVVAIEPGARIVKTESGASFHYEVLSLNLGSETHVLPGENERVFPIKPLRNLWRLRQALAAAENPRVVIAGGGASGCEIAANLRALLGPSAEISILARGREIAFTFAPKTQRVLAGALEARNIAVQLHAEVIRLENNAALTSLGQRFEYDFLVNATGLHPPPILAQSGLPVSEHGELLLDDQLRSLGDPRIFAGGDCARLQSRELAKIGVYAVRASPVLFHNLLATLGNRPLRTFQPQRHFLLVLNLGAGVGLATWRGFYWLGRAAFWLKDRLDRSFLARFQKSG